MVAKPPEGSIPMPQFGGRSFSPSGCNPNGRCGNGLEKIYPTCAVRYGHMAYIGEFKYSQGMLFGCGGKVVIQTNRGIEIGEQVSLTCTGCDKSITRQQMLAYAKNSGSDAFQLRAGRILREATPQDLEEEARINADIDRKLARARELSEAHALPMKFVACEHLFGGERVIFHFMSEKRVDFRDIVRDLAHEYHTRIEMHQVGARDEARLVADYEICGRECCCKNFLKRLRPVSMRMAKLQKATLDPSKVSGRCGRLRCCLRYEHDGYEDLNKKLPRLGTRVRTARGVGTIRDRQVLTQLVMVLYDNEQTESLGVEELLETGLPPRAAPTQSPADNAPRDGGRERDRHARKGRRADAGRERPPPTRDAGPSGSERRGEGRRRSSMRTPQPQGQDETTTDPRPGSVGDTKPADSASSGDEQQPAAPPEAKADHTPAGEAPGSPTRTPEEQAGRARRRSRRGRRRRRRPPESGETRDGPADGGDAQERKGNEPPSSDDRPGRDPDSDTG